MDGVEKVRERMEGMGLERVRSVCYYLHAAYLVSPAFTAATGWDVARWYSACLACLRPWVRS
jgi:hypothetical protein